MTIFAARSAASSSVRSSTCPPVRAGLRVLVVTALALLASACSQRFAVSVNEQPIYDPRPNTTEYRFQDPGLQACVNIALQRPNTSVDSITTLACPGWQIAVIEGIDALRALQHLDISDNNISSIAPLDALDNLSTLTASNNRISDIALLQSMATLTAATLNGNNNIPCQQLDALGQKLGGNLSRPQSCRQ